jgi:hypothetical protein
MLKNLRDELVTLKGSYEMMLRIPNIDELPLKFDKVYDVILYEGKDRIDIRVAGRTAERKVNNKTIKSWKKEKGRYLIMPITEYIYLFRLIRSIDRFVEVSPYTDCSFNTRSTSNVQRPTYADCIDEIKKKLLKRKQEIEERLGFEVDFDKYADVWLYKVEYKDGTYIQLRANAYDGSRKVAVKVPEYNVRRETLNVEPSPNEETIRRTSHVTRHPLQEYVAVYRALKRLNKVEKLLLSVVDLIRET